ncbi:S-layer homology domain-containing protein [Saccharibacillus sacchari]|uniref:S-layer homology domain-containing protein n=1 Tax=Saccharibacillus sacchari TaxID=456493 RepID=UPI0004B81465|nr:S-layer homology domain-containing protein [Saccharibacillus sacchari]
MKTSASNFFSAKGVAASAIAASAIAFPLSAQAASDAAVPPQSLMLQSNDAERAVLRGIIQGDPQGNLAEERALTRAEFAVLVARAFGLEPTKASVSSYKDIKASSWASPAIEALRAKGWMSGSGNAFLPNAPVTQEQMAIVLAKALDLTAEPIQIAGAGVSDESLASASSWAATSLKQAASAGLLGVYVDGIQPGKQVLRGEAASAVLAASNLQTQKIEAVQGGIVKFGGVPYRVSPEVAGLFAASNAAALVGANAKVTISGGVVKAVRGLELNAAGQAAANGQDEFSGNVVLNGGGSKIEGGVTVNGDFFTLNELSIDGNLTISGKVEHDFLSESLTVKGDTNVLGGDENTVVFGNAKLNTMNVNKQNVHVDLTGVSTVAKLFAQNDLTISGGLNSKIAEFFVDPKTGKVLINAAVGSLNISGLTKVGLGSDARIESLTLPQNTSPSSVIENYSAVSGKVGSVNGQSSAPVGSTPAVPTPNVSTPAAGSGTTLPSTPSVPTPAVDKTLLDAAIKSAQELLKSTNSGTESGQVPQKSADALAAAIQEAKTASASASISASAIGSAIQKLGEAVKAFKKASTVQAYDKLVVAIRDAENALLEAAVGEVVGKEYPEMPHQTLTNMVEEANLILGDSASSEEVLFTAAQNLTVYTEFLRDSKNYTHLARQIFVLEVQIQEIDTGVEQPGDPEWAYEQFKNAVGAIKIQHADQYQIEPELEQQLLLQLQDAQQKWTALRKSWQNLNESIAIAESALNSEENTDPSNFRPILQSAVVSAKALLENTSATPQDYDQQGMNLTMTTQAFIHGLNKNQAALSNYDQDFADPQSLSYNEETDSFELVAPSGSDSAESDVTLSAPIE